MTSLVGQTVTHYRILEKLGEGGMGVVYKAEDTKLKRVVALKFLPRGLETHEPEQSRFLQEAQAAAALNHPNICTVHDVVIGGDQPFIVMEYVEGTTLRDLVPVKQTQDAITYAIQIAEALQEAHAHGVVHRDIKAENIMVNSKNQVKVMDFGLAKWKGSLKLTKTSSTVGTLAYMAPEQLEGGEVDARNDIFSFGVVLYELLTGHLPFRGEHEAAMMYSILNEEPTSLQAYMSDAPSELVHTLNRALEKDPEERYQTVQDMLIDLRRLKRETGRVARSSAKKAAPEPIPRSVRGSLGPFLRERRWAAAGIAVILVGIIGWLIVRLGGGGGPAGGEAKSIAVMYFENRTQERDLDRILVDMLVTNLGRNREITVVSGQRLYDILKSLGKEDAAVIDRTTATEAARLAGARTMLVGSMWSVGGKLSVTGQLLDVASGAVINSERVEASKAEEVFAVADRFTEKVNEWLKGSRKEELRIADATTGSFDAYRHYEQGMRHMYRWEASEARKCFEAAVRIDSTFAMGHYRLSRARGQALLSSTPGVNLNLARESAAQARLYAKNLSEKERERIESWNAVLRRDYDGASETLERLLERYPDEKDFWLSAGILAMVKGDNEKAIRLMERATEVDRAFSDAYNLLAYSYCKAGQFEKAFATIRTYMALIPDASNAYDSGWEVYTMSGRFEEGLKLAEEGYRRIPSWSASFGRQAESYLLMREPEKALEKIAQVEQLHPGALEWAERVRAVVYCFEGRMSEAVDVLGRAVERTHSADDGSNELLARFYRARILLQQSRIEDATREIDAVKSLSRVLRKDPSNPWPLLCDYYAGLSLARRGEYVKAEASASAIRSAVETSVGDTHYLSYYNGLIGEILSQRGNHRDALKALDRVIPIMRSQFPQIRMLDGSIAVALGDEKRAAQIYGGFRNFTSANTSGVGGEYLDFWIEQSKLDYYVAMMHERFGNRGGAVFSYREALSNWKKADNDYPPYIDARKRLLNLTQ